MRNYRSGANDCKDLHIQFCNYSSRISNDNHHLKDHSVEFEVTDGSCSNDIIFCVKVPCLVLLKRIIFYTPTLPLIQLCSQELRLNSKVV